MQKNNITKVLINAGFTLFLISVCIGVIIESKLYFRANFKEKKEVILSSLKNYRVKHFSETPDASYDISSSFSKANIYDKKPLKIIQKLQNIHEIENRLSENMYQEVGNEESELPPEIVNNIISDPLFKGYYIQLGIFSEKGQAKISIQNLLDKLLIDGSFTTYIETKYIQEKTFYLAQIGVFSTKNDAINFCDKLQKMGVGCLIVD